MLGSLMKPLIIVAVTMSPASAQERHTVYDKDGSAIESIEDSGSRWIRRDRGGNRLNTAEKPTFGRGAIRDDQGDRIGTIEQETSGRRLIRDRKGNVEYQIDPPSYGRSVIRDKNGKKVGEIR